MLLISRKLQINYLYSFIYISDAGLGSIYVNVLKIKLTNDKVDEVEDEVDDEVDDEVEDEVDHEVELSTKAKTSKVHNFTTVRADRLHKSGGGLITLVRDNITFTTTGIPSTMNTHNTELHYKTVDMDINTAYSTSRTYHTKFSP